MKRLCFVAVVVLMALAMFSCDGLAQGGGTDKNILYTADGREMVELNIGFKGAGRSLTEDLAKAGVDYMEVAFFDGTDYYRTAWDYPKSGRLHLPLGDYPTSADAILFAGNRVNKTLLAVGIISANDGDDGTGTNVTGTVYRNTTYITFTLVPLVCEITDDATSAFQITGPDYSSTNKANGDDTDYQTASVSGTLPTVKVEGYAKEVSVFMVPKDDTTITAEYTISMPSTYNLSDYYDGIYVKAAPSFYSRCLYLENEDELLTITAALDAGSSLAAGAILATNKVELEIETPDVDGLAWLSYEMPVNLIAATAGKNGLAAGEWFIRSGLDIGRLDSGGNSVGGAVVLGAGTIENINSIVIKFTGI